MRARIRLCRVLSLALTVILLSPVSAALRAQAATGNPNRAPVYDPATETTVSGTVEAVNQVTDRRGWNGTHIQLKTDKGTMDVHVGPSSFLARQKFQIATGDQVVVTGSKIRYNEADAVVARTIKKGDSEITLRNAQGIPAWSRGRRF